MDRRRFGTDRISSDLEVTPQLHCDSCTNKCGTRTQTGRDSEVPEQVKPLETPEEREKTRERFSKRFPAPPTEAEVTLGSTFAFERPQPEEEQEQSPSTEEVIDKSTRTRRAIDSQNLRADAVVTRARFIQGDRLLASCQEHKHQNREEWTQDLLRRRGKRE